MTYGEYKTRRKEGWESITGFTATEEVHTLDTATFERHKQIIAKVYFQHDIGRNEARRGWKIRREWQTWLRVLGF